MSELCHELFLNLTGLALSDWGAVFMSTHIQAVFVPKAGTVNITVNDDEGLAHDYSLKSEVQ